jgi:hypothetical protein
MIPLHIKKKKPTYCRINPLKSKTTLPSREAMVRWNAGCRGAEAREVSRLGLGCQAGRVGRAQWAVRSLQSN